MKREDGVLLEQWGNGKEELRLHRGDVETVIHWSTFPARDWYPTVAMTSNALKALDAARAPSPPSTAPTNPPRCEKCLGIEGRAVTIDGRLAFSCDRAWCGHRTFANPPNASPSRPVTAYAGGTMTAVWAAPPSTAEPGAREGAAPGRPCPKCGGCFLPCRDCTAGLWCGYLCPGGHAAAPPAPVVSEALVERVTRVLIRGESRGDAWDTMARAAIAAMPPPVSGPDEPPACACDEVDAGTRERCPRSLYFEAKPPSAPTAGSGTGEGRQCPGCRGRGGSYAWPFRWVTCDDCNGTGKPASQPSEPTPGGEGG